MRAILTLDNGYRFPVILTPTKKVDARRMDKLEKDIVKNWNLSQLRMVHKVVKCHLLRN